MKSEKDTLLSVFVYGTLRPNQALFESIAHFQPEHKPAIIKGKLFMNTGGWFPVYKKDGDTDVVGDLLTFREEQIGTVMAILDRVEGVPVLYKRDTVVTNDGDNAYVYVGNSAGLGEEITSGDFLNR